MTNWQIEKLNKNKQTNKKIIWIVSSTTHYTSVYYTYPAKNMPVGVSKFVFEFMNRLSNVSSAHYHDAIDPAFKYDSKEKQLKLVDKTISPAYTESMYVVNL